MLDDGYARISPRPLRSELSPRHVPDEIRAVTAIPRTLTGKKLETPVKRLLMGEPLESVASRDSLLEPRALDALPRRARRRAPRRLVVGSLCHRVGGPSRAGSSPDAVHVDRTL